MKHTLDRIDHEIIACLQNDARQSNKELAAAVGLAPSSCLERVRRLRQAGVVLGFHADIEPRALGIGLHAMVAVRLHQHGREQFESFQAHVGELPEVIAFYHVAGADDFLIHLALRDADHLRDVTYSGFTQRPEVLHIQTSLIFEFSRASRLPDYGADDLPRKG